jgi:hypothetical protein
MFNESFNQVVTQSSCALPAKGYWFLPTFLTSGTQTALAMIEAGATRLGTSAGVAIVKGLAEIKSDG